MPSKTQSIIVGGLVVGLLNTSVLQVVNILCCAGVILGAMAGVWHYTSTHGLTISSGQGVLIGVLSGVAGAVVASILNYVLAVAGLDLISQFTLRFAENADVSPDLVEMLRQQAEASTTIGALVSSLITSAVLFAVFGAIGGAIGASVFKRGGDAPGGNADGGPGGPRSPVGGRPRPSGPSQARTPQSEPEPREARRPQEAYRPSREEEGAAAPSS